MTDYYDSFQSLFYNLDILLNDPQWKEHFLEVAKNLSEEEKELRRQIQLLYLELTPNVNYIHQNILFNPLEYSMNGILLRPHNPKNIPHRKNATLRIYTDKIGDNWNPDDEAALPLKDDNNYYNNR